MIKLQPSKLLASFPGPAQLSVACSTKKRFFVRVRGEPGNEATKLLCDAKILQNSVSNQKLDGSVCKKPMGRNKTSLYTGYFDLGIQR